MLRRALVIAMLMLLTVPSFASAYNYWSITVSTPIPGTVTPRPQPDIIISGNTTYVTSQLVTSVDFTVNPEPAGYLLAYVVIDGVKHTAPNNGAFYTVYKGTRTGHTLSATYTTKKYTITTSKSGNGYIDPTVLVSAGSNKTITMTPGTGHVISSVSDGGATRTGGDGVTYAAYTFSNVLSDKSISVAFAPIPVVDARISTASQSVPTGSSVIIDGSASTSSITPTYNWAVSPAGATLTPAADGKSASFTSSTVGRYTVTLTLTAPGAITDQASVAIEVVSAGAYQSNACTSCHNDRNPDIVAAYLSSPHALSAQGASCSDCHNPDDNLPHTYLPYAEMASICRNCHADSQGNVADHAVEIGSNECVLCHNPHSAVGVPYFTHFNNVTSAGYPASYVTSRAACENCHNESGTNAVRRQEWNKSGHAAVTDPSWTVFDFKTESGCVQCHSTTGFIAYSSAKVTAAWGESTDKTKEVLTCIGCHSDVPNGVLRTMAPARPYADDAYVNRDFGKSNICASCHSGRRNGASIGAQLEAQADFSNLPFIDPHYHAAAGTVQGKAGYHFPGQASYAFYSSNSHRRIGLGNFNGTGSSGPCIACHRNDTNSHTNKALINTMCGNCHGATFTVDELSVDRQAFHNALSVLNAMLAQKGYNYSSTLPNFSNSNWGTGEEGAHTMGAAFNYVMLLNDSGAYAHNSAYAKKLTFDSIDYLQNGAITGSIDGALADLVGSGKISQEVADSVAAYKAEVNCTLCHANTSGSHSAHLDSGFNCADCHSSTATGNTTLLSGNLTHVNGAPDVLAGTGRSFGYTFAASGGTCSSISCHNNGTAVWGGTLGCDGCHDAPPATASHLKHYAGGVALAGYGNTGSAKDEGSSASAYLMNCGNCHPLAGAKHGNGVVDVELYNPLAPAGSLKALNPASAAYVAGAIQFSDSRGLVYTEGTCSNVYCHSYTESTTTAAIPEFDPNWAAKTVSTRKYKAITWGSAPLTCSGCHGNPTQSTSANNDGGAGDSHSWIDPYGYQNLHTYNMGFAPVSCRYCHNDTVKQVNTWTSNGLDVRTLSDVPIENFAKHVNGVKDVAFDKQNPFVYQSGYSGNVSHSLANAVYDPGTKTCSNVACHREETTVKWGTPYRWYTNECNKCHSY
jgi:predicted CxxxxCH...CXXCH cytochrome family protein